ncbi:MAG: DHH family phosphoesterase, partial [Alicyclobacillus shizuokensis]|nr:DHH family phosphoesterase [Alicyclobacillus shizuokensis]
LGLAALGALADVMPMVGENRRLVVEGLAALRRCRRPGWLALCAVAGLDADSVTATDVLWRIAPRLNSAGRMDTAEHALALLLAADPGEAQARAEDIERLNGLRKVETERAFTQAQEQAREQIAAGCGFLVSHGPWPLGVVGIVAAKLSETYGMPALVLADTGDTLLRGSGRAPSGFPLHQALADSAELFDHFGGHDEAVGCGLSRERLVEVRERLSAFAAAWQSERLPSASTPQVLADDYLPLADATLELAAWIDRLGPYGPGHPMWRFCVGPARIVQVRWMGDGRHVRIKVSEAGNFQDLVWFHAPPSVSTWKPGDTVTAIVELEQNVWQGRVRVQLRVIQAGLSNRVLTREHFADLYRLLRARRRLQAVEAVREAPGYGLDQVATMLNTFVELGFARLSDHAYHVVESAAPRDLREAAHYRDHLRTNAAWSV